MEKSMSNRHQPRDAFASGLEERLRATLAHRATAMPLQWMPRTRRGLALATAAIVVVSMAIGGGVVAVAYEQKQAELRDMLVETYRQRLLLAEKQLALARQQLRDAEGRVAAGLAPPAEVQDARLKVRETEAEFRITEIDVNEVLATGREPMKTVAAPLVSGRDLVSDRMRVEMSVKEAALEAAKLHAQAAKTRFDVGLAGIEDVEAAGARQSDVESALEHARVKLQIRQRFLGGQISAPTAELLVVEADTERRRAALARRVDFMHRQMNDLRTRVEIGTLSPLDVAGAELRLLELELALKKAQYDLALIRQQIGK
jgi:hypothetical protein